MIDQLNQFVASAFRISSPLMLAAAGGLLSRQVGVENITLEGMMLTAAFFAVWASYAFQSALMAVAFALLSAILFNLIFTFFVKRFRSDEIITGLAMNTIAWGVTSYLLLTIFDTTGSFISDRIVPVPRLSMPLLVQVPVLGGLFFNQSILTYLAPLILVLLQVYLYRTRSGIWIRAIGEAPETARSVGIKVPWVVYRSSIVTAILCGLAGAQLSLGFLAMFSENMSVGRGFIAYAAVLFGRNVPLRVLAITLFFGLADAVGLQLQRIKYPPQFILMVPYIVTVIALSVSSARRLKSRSR